MTINHWIRRSSVVGLVVASALGASSAWAAYAAPYTTPAGITLVDVSKLMDAGAPQFIWRRLGDEQGKPLYTSDADQNGKSSCVADCLKEFTPYVAKSGAKAFGDWTIVSGANHVKQWAYQGKPLYSYTGTDPRGEPQGARFQLKEDPAWHDPSSKVFSPKEGWTRAAYTPEKTAVMPTSVEIAALAIAGGVGYTTPITHMTVYSAPVSHKLSPDFRPVHAAALAVPVGAFGIVTRKDDSTRQWTYHGDVLYTYAGDSAPGEANGLSAGDKDVQAALAYRDYRPDGIDLGQYPGRGALMTTAKGETLYTVARFHATYGGLEGIGGYTISYNELKSQGTVGCEGDCTTTWKPIVADKNAQSDGFWEIVTRPDGVKQWAYKGSPVYTYIGDKKPGDIEGNNRYVVAFGGAHGEMTYADAGNDPRSPQGHIGNLNMAVAVGMKPGDKPAYVAGQGYVASRSEGGRGNATGAAGGGGGATATVADANAAGGATPDDDDVGNGVGGTARSPDHGAGFYWHTIQLF